MVYPFLLDSLVLTRNFVPRLVLDALVAFNLELVQIKIVSKGN